MKKKNTYKRSETSPPATSGETLRSGLVHAVHTHTACVYKRRMPATAVYNINTVIRKEEEEEEGGKKRKGFTCLLLLRLPLPPPLRCRPTPPPAVSHTSRK